MPDSAAARFAAVHALMRMAADPGVDTAPAVSASARISGVEVTR